MEDILSIGFWIIVGALILYGIISAIVDKIKEPFETKTNFVELENKNKDYINLSEKANQTAAQNIELKSQLEQTKAIEQDLRKQLNDANIELKSQLEQTKAIEQDLRKQLNDAKQELSVVKRDAAYAKSQEKQFFMERQQLRKKYTNAMSELENRITKEVSKRTCYLKESIKPRPELLSPFYELCDLDAYQQSIMQGLFQRAFNQQPKILKVDISTTIHSCSEDKEYKTTLSSCTCPDHGYRDRPCKHMLYLAYLLGLLQINEKEHRKAVETYNDYCVQIAELKECIQIERAKHKKLQSVNIEIQNAINEVPNAIFRVSGIMADLVDLQFKESEIYLRCKQPHAPNAANEVAQMRKIVRKIMERNKELEYKIEALEKWFPNIHDVYDINFCPDMWELEPHEPTAHEIKDYISKHINSIKYNNLK